MPWHTIEREQLSDARSAVAPDSPTLCEGWQARHLGVILVGPDGVRRVLPRARDGRGPVVVHGTMGEVTPYLFGRGAATAVELLGTEDDLAELSGVLPT